MNEDVFNTSLRGFLKKVGITSQREIEKVVRDAIRFHIEGLKEDGLPVPNPTSIADYVET